MNHLILISVFMPMAAAFVSYAVGRRTKTGRDFFVGLVVILEFLVCVWMASGSDGASAQIPEICGMGLYFTVDGFRGIYAVITAFMWMVTGLFSPEYFIHYRNRNRYYLFFLITLGATVGIFLSADLFTTFVFFEVMSLASYVWVAQDEKPKSLQAASLYLAVAVIGGMVMLMGLFLLYRQTGTLMIDELPKACAGKNLYAVAICLFVGFGAKAGAFPLHIWLPKAHPVAPAPASALLSGILTKTGIFGILVISCKILPYDETWGAVVLLTGTVTMFLGAVLALFSVDVKRTLACSSVSQIGFILIGVGMIGLLGEDNAVAVRGTFLHMVNHSLFKLVLFLAAGVIFMNIHCLNLNEVRGFGRKKPMLAFIFLMGALGISGFPLWSGYISKTLLHESVVEYMEKCERGIVLSGCLQPCLMKAVEWIFLISGGITVAYMCKLFVAVFLEKNSDLDVQKRYDAKRPYMKRLSGIVLLISALLIPLMGMLPYSTMDTMAFSASEFMGNVSSGHPVHYFVWSSMKGGLISVGIGFLLYFTVVRGWMMKKKPDGSNIYVDRWPAFLDLEERVYRPLLLKVLPSLFGELCRALDSMTDMLAKILPAIGSVLAGILDILADSVVVFLRKTVYRDSPDRSDPDEGNVLTRVFGSWMNAQERFLNHTLWRNHQHKRDFEHWLALKYSSFKENSTIIARSLSYGLVLFCIGLCATLIYLLVSMIL